MSTASDPVIRIDGLTKRFGEFVAVDDLSFSVPQGSIFGFLGPNGAGKTTTIGMLIGLIPPDEGEAEVLGHDIRHDFTGALARIGAFVEAPAFYPYLSGQQNLSFVATLRGIEDPGVVERTLETVGLADAADRKFGGYSLGMRQRMGLASVLIGDPDLLILDEPTGGLDPAGQREIRTLIQELAGSGHTVFLSSHQLFEIQEICSHVAIIDHGRLVTTGPMEQILGTGEFLEIGVDRASEACEFLLAQPDVRGVEIQDGHLIVDADISQAAVINRALVEAGFDIDLLRPRESLLEERFLALTEGMTEEVEA